MTPPETSSLLLSPLHTAMLVLLAFACGEIAYQRRKLRAWTLIALLWLTGGWHAYAADPQRRARLFEALGKKS